MIQSPGIFAGDLLDLDFNIEDCDGKFSVADIHFRKDNGILRSTYDQNDNMIPVPTAEIKPTQEGSSVSAESLLE